VIRHDNVIAIPAEPPLEIARSSIHGTRGGTREETEKRDSAIDADSGDNHLERPRRYHPGVVAERQRANRTACISHWRRQVSRNRRAAMIAFDLIRFRAGRRG